MPVEESGNMLILWPRSRRSRATPSSPAVVAQLTKWAEYLKEKGLDPENQLSTDDFAGHLAHNANLSIKAILALAPTACLPTCAGTRREAAHYRKTAQEFAEKWNELAADGDHYRLAFDKPGTWSQKYNLVWDKLLGLNFSRRRSRARRSPSTRRSRTFGLPLDNRKDYTKLDWVLWTATLADNPADFRRSWPGLPLRERVAEPRAAHRLVRHLTGKQRASRRAR